MSDLISRQEAIEAVATVTMSIHLSNVLCDKPLALPSADRPTGEWVEKDGETVCSLCGNSVSFSWTEDGWVLGKFCQTCGAKMGVNK